MKTKAISPITFLTGLLLVLTTSIFTSCQDEITSAGIELMPDAGYFVPKYDELTGMTAQNTLFPVRTDDALIGMLGVYEDSTFGDIQADFLVQILPVETAPLATNYDTVNKDSIKISRDSFPEEDIYLYLHFPINKYSWTGDSLAEHRLSIYELKDGLNNEEYYSDMEVDNLHYPDLLAVQIVKANDGTQKIDSTLKTRKEIINGVEVTKQYYEYKYGWVTESAWKIKMPKPLTDRFYNLAYTPPFNTSQQDTAVRDVFLEYFKGLYVTSELADASKKSMIPIALKATKPLRLELVFTRIKITETKATGDTTHTITHGTRTYTTNYERKRIARALPLTSGNIPTDAGNAENLYIQAVSGRAAKIQLDTEQLYQWKDSLLQNNRHFGFSNIELTLSIDQDKTIKAKYKPMANLQIWLKRLNGELTDQPWFSYVNGYNGVKWGYVFQNLSQVTYYKNTYINVPYGSLDSDSLAYHFQIDPNYFEAYLRFLNNPADTTFTNEHGKFKGFTDKDDNGSYLYIYDLNELLLMPSTTDIENQSASAAYNIKRVVLESPTHLDTKTKLKIKYFAY